MQTLKLDHGFKQKKNRQKKGRHITRKRAVWTHRLQTKLKTQGIKTGICSSTIQPAERQSAESSPENGRRGEAVLGQAALLFAGFSYPAGLVQHTEPKIPSDLLKIVFAAAGFTL